MQFHEALLQVYKNGAKIRVTNWPDSQAYVYWDGKRFVDNIGIPFDPCLNYCVTNDWAVLKVRQEYFVNVKIGEKFKRANLVSDELLTKIPGHLNFNAINQEGTQTFKIEEARLVNVVE